MTARFEFAEFDTGEVVLRYACAGDPAAPLILFLHGFPEYWAGWRAVMERLAGRFRVVAPDQRGYNRSSKPAGVDAYRGRHLAADIAALADHLSPGMPFVLCGHDWGASVAYAYAFQHPDRLTHLVIANGVHPVCFQRAINDDPEQRAASQYINRLRAPEADERMAEDGYARTLKMIEKFSATAWMTPGEREGYIDAWSQPGALGAMLNWYRATPLVVPAPGEPAPDAAFLAMPAELFRVRMPHLVIWGEADQALRPSCLEGLDEFAPDLTIERVPGSGHWILHERPDAVARLVAEFVAR
jgi:epoxide hydrolase 4